MADAFTALESVGSLAWQASWHGAVLAALVLLSMRLHIVRRALSPGWRSALWLLVGVRLALPLAPPLPTSIHNFYRDPFYRDRFYWNAVSLTPNASTALPIEPLIKRPIAPAAGRLLETGEHVFLKQPTPAPATASAAPLTTSTVAALVWCFALFGWVAGTVIVGTRYAIGVWRLGRIIGSCDAVRDERVLSLAEECRRECGLEVRPALKRVPGTFGPTVAGFWRPTLLLSDATLRMDWQSLRFILLHEMRHIRTGDCWIGWMLRGLTAIHWFNPFCWLAARSWQAERELACDAWVLRHADANERRHYGETLLQVVEQASLGHGALFATGMASSPRLLERRIRDVRQPTARSGWQHAAAVLVLSAVALVGFADPVRSQPAANPAGAPKSAAASPSVARILRSWKAREDRAKTLHCVWDTEKSSVRKPGKSRTAMPRGRAPLPAAHHECWLGRDSQYRFETTTERSDGPSGHRERNYYWTTFDGRANSSLKGAEHSTRPRRGKICDFGGRRPLGFLDRELTPLAWVYRPSLRVDLNPGQFTLVTEDAIANGLRCAKLRLRQGGTLSSFWFDPRQGDALVLWEWEVSGSVWDSLSLRYQSDKSSDPTPVGWTARNNDGADDVSKLKMFEINKELPADAFQIKFPPGTAVAIDLDGSTQEAYVVKPDGTKRTIFNLNSISPPLRRTLLVRTDFTIEPEPLRAAIDFVRTRYGIAIAMDEASFRAAKIDPSLDVQEDTPGIRLWKVLTWLSTQCPRPFGIFEQNGSLLLKPL